jgi:hypothetical protein
MRPGFYVVDKSNDVNGPGNETRQDIRRICRRADTLGFNRREQDNFGGRGDGGMVITSAIASYGRADLELDE